MSQTSAIGLFDSGIGGLTVLQELKKQLPFEHFIYFGDTARVPYGNKSQETIIRYCIENTIALLEKDIKLLIVACNTASAFALPKLRQLFNLPIIGVIDPGVKQAAAVTKNQRIAVLGTHGTIYSQTYQKALLALLPKAQILPISCPLFVPLVEEQLFDHPATELFIKEYLKPIKDQASDTVLLGCTHYPFLQKAIQQELGSTVKIVNSAFSCAEEVKEILKKNRLNNLFHQKGDVYYTSDAPEKFKTLSEKLFNLRFESVNLLLPPYL